MKAESDHLSLIKIFDEWKQSGRRHNWSSEHFLQHRALIQAENIYH